MCITLSIPHPADTSTHTTKRRHIDAVVQHTSFNVVVRFRAHNPDLEAGLTLFLAPGSSSKGRSSSSMSQSLLDRGQRVGRGVGQRCVGKGGNKAMTAH